MKNQLIIFLVAVSLQARPVSAEDLATATNGADTIETPSAPASAPISSSRDLQEFNNQDTFLNYDPRSSFDFRDHLARIFRNIFYTDYYYDSNQPDGNLDNSVRGRPRTPFLAQLPQRIPSTTASPSTTPKYTKFPEHDPALYATKSPTITPTFKEPATSTSDISTTDSNF